MSRFVAIHLGNLICIKDMLSERGVALASRTLAMRFAADSRRNRPPLPAALVRRGNRSVLHRARRDRCLLTPLSVRNLSKKAHARKLFVNR